MKHLFLAASLAAVMTLPAHAADYVVDTQGAHASVQFKISHLGYSWLHGRFNTFAGEFSYDAEKLAESKIKLTIDTTSLDSNHAERDKHLRSADFLNTAKNPQATFTSTKVVPKDAKHFDIYGNLTLNGVTKEVIIAAESMGEGKDPWGGYRAGFSGSTALTLKDFGINYNLGPASEVVYLDLSVEGVRK